MWSWTRGTTAHLPPPSFLPSGDVQNDTDPVFTAAETPRLSQRVSGELVICANSQHLYQVLSGFLLLQRAKIVDVAIRLDKFYRPRLPTSHIAELRVAGGPTIAYDMIDGYNFAGPVTLDEYLEHVDCYFKRSYHASSHAQVANASRIQPFGLNYPVTVKHRFFASLGPDGLRSLPSRAAWCLAGVGAITVGRFEDVPRHHSEPQIIFQTRTWDPAEVDNADWKDERVHMNEMRAGLVRRLRAEFGPRFRGGFMPSDHARRHFSDCVLDLSSASKRRYMNILKSADICIATAGLHGSNGWSLGEYVAASKAIVAQHLRYDVPGFQNGRHYLGFANADECVAHVATLVSDAGKLRQMKNENYAFYQRYLRPDRLVLNSLLLALNQCRV